MTHNEAQLVAIGRYLARRFATWELIVQPLPQVMLDDLTRPQRDLIEAQAGSDWFRFVLDGWEQVQNASR